MHVLDAESVYLKVVGGKPESILLLAPVCLVLEVNAESIMVVAVFG